MSTSTIHNGKPQRKQLSDQLDRFDCILDGLSDGLHDAVVDAARDGIRLALKDAIVEILTDPALREQLHSASAPASPPAPAVNAPKPGFWAALKAKASQAMQAVRGAAANAADAVSGHAAAVTQTVVRSVHSLRAFGSLIKLVGFGLGVGVAWGLITYCAPHSVAAALSGISGAVATSALQLRLWAWRQVRRLAMH